MFAEIITIGDEILIGQITDTNSKWIAEELNKIGVSVYQITSVQDDKAHILKSLKEAEENADIVIITGGLGPTKDDITKHTLAEYFNSELELNEEVVEHIRGLFAKINYPFTEVNRMQALVPTNCTPLKNHLGTAPGMWFEQNGRAFVSLPGVPNEMKGLMKMEVLPRIQSKYKLPFIIHKTIMTYGMGESMVAEKLEDWENNLPKSIRLAYLPSYGKVRLRLSAKGIDRVKLESILIVEIEKLHTIIGDIIVGYDESENIAVVLGRLLKEKGLKIATAESCTGGKIASRITSVAGASSYFVGSIVSYTAEMKIKELNVSKDTIDTYTVVSGEVAEQMALGIQKRLNVDYAIATTGNAGPTTDNTDKTVGVVFIAIATPKGVFSEEFYFGKPRQKVIERSTNKALELLRKEIIKNS
ncbi:competence/damage-inducible protein A [Urechidicola croceus]|uniref:CinA-like protein n=1 Tax=Urechidicola croceus TaxID=1850246 RepID=A0A1D8P419_9FLAO|nr:competence/damage-inducible protein A [Urechidicola croceus]AOW19261.1 damage-inducible protein CinA [Urechidicola croceus]